VRGSKTRETSAVNGGEWARLFAFCSYSCQGNGPRYPLDRPLGGLESTYVRSGFCMAKRKKIRKCLLRPAWQFCASCLFYKQHSNDQAVFILQYALRR